MPCPGTYLGWVRDGSSEAALKVFGGLNGSEPDGEINGTVGGTVYPVLYVTIGAGERCTTGSVTLRIADEYPGYWDGTEAYTDTSISLSSASGWEVYNGSSWAGAQDGPSGTDNKEGATPLQYRHVVTGGWLTHKTPFGNNGPHSLSTTSQIEFEEWVVGQGWTNEYPCGPAATSVTTENLWISSCTASNGTIDYFKYDPDGGPDLAHPHLKFTISDADPHKYCCIIRFRETIGEGTWNWDSGWSSMRKNLGINRTVDIDLTVPDDEGHCLNEDDHEWGTYTYDFLVLEYDGASPEWIQNDAHDWNFLKRYREGYYLWVPEDLPSPYGDKPGHSVWTEAPEDGSTQFRGYYCLESEWATAEEAQVPRGDDVCIVVVDPELNERATKTGPSVPETLGANYGTVDNDQNQELDGLLLYTFQDSDPAGTWRGIFTAADNGGLRSPEWRSHTPLRMITANWQAMNHALLYYQGPDSNPAWGQFIPAPVTKIKFSGGGEYVHSLTMAHRIPQCTANELWQRVSHFESVLGRRPAWYKVWNVHTNTHGVDVGSGLWVQTQGKAPEALMNEFFEDGEQCGQADGIPPLTADGIESNTIWPSPDLCNVHFWMVAACQAGGDQFSFAQCLTDNGADVTAGFGAKVVDDIGVGPIRWGACHSEYMRLFYGHCKAGHSIADALELATDDFKTWVEEGIGLYDNPKGDSTKYYGYDTYVVWGKSSDLLLDVTAP